MSQLDDIQKAQQSLEECVMKKMEELQAQLQGGAAAKDTVAKVAEEFRTFRELTFSMLSLLRKQIAECSKAADIMETRDRRKFLLLTGVPEQSGENCLSLVLDIVHHKLAMKDITAASIKVCHRLGSQSNPSIPHKCRPLLVKFSTIDIKAAIFRAKTKLKGTPFSLREFLTKVRQSVFSKARMHFGLRGCWTLDGAVIIKSTDGKRHKVTSMEELQPLMQKYQKATPSIVSSNAGK
ncbi:uncharacterized protein LOC121739879 [Aricia agestis]|uniref:uncharacterized protein LOC121739879 n=1 Tax=Aricia agestis TaxID=91739 RepID=UPI001C208690|nr:uncharacterized protein LOC121739879 [Aricia agestis]